MDKQCEQYRGLKAFARFRDMLREGDGEASRYQLTKLIGKGQPYYRRCWQEGGNQPTQAQIVELSQATGIPIVAIWCHLYEVHTEDVPAILAAFESQGVDMDKVAELVIERAAIREGTE